MQGYSTTDLPILLIDDEPGLLRSLEISLRSSGFKRLVSCDDSRKVMKLLAKQGFGMVLLDLCMPYVSGQDLIPLIKEDYPDIPIIVMTAMDDLETAVQSMQSGAADYLVKPLEKNRLLAAINRASELRDLLNEVLLLKRQLIDQVLEHAEAFQPIVTQDKKMRSIFNYIEAVASSSQPILITGETGTGKELVARAIHILSGRSGDFIAVNVAGLDDNVFSDTLFGHSKGAFTGAERARQGLVAQAEDGTLLLDEIGDLGMTCQVKLLRLLQESRYYPLGTDRPRYSHARTVVATNSDLPERMSQGSFRKDLYYRLRTHHIHLPPLRERRGDLPLLVSHFLEKASKILNKPVPTTPKELYTLLANYDFPGNVRELEAMIFDALARHQGNVLSLRSFKENIGNVRPSSSTAVDEEQEDTQLEALFSNSFPTLKQAEERLIVEALHRADNNQSIAADLLGITRQALNKRLIRRRQKARFHN